MTILITMTSALIVITAYSLGVWTGSRFYCPDRDMGNAYGNRGNPVSDNRPVSGRYLEPVELRKRPRNGNTNPTHVDVCDKKPASDATEVLTDTEKQKRFEEDLKAFQDCMNYCQEKAYGVET